MGVLGASLLGCLETSKGGVYVGGLYRGFLYYGVYLLWLEWLKVYKRLKFR